MKRKYHNPDSLYSKWRTANQSIMEFNDIYLNAICKLQNGVTEVDVMAKVHQIYKAKFERSFSNESFWGVMMRKLKMVRSKKINIYNDEPCQVLTRPMGRYKEERKLNGAQISSTEVE
ncbi:unnamed protein product [Lactuca saligna]|uniref:Uncharacterized protein n=1 Tax=Lactuca saligna TaxID=75948 RepID=A0AA35Y334_LACSI|nr:unnamed protein product [Lactuca saligna]